MAGVVRVNVVVEGQTEETFVKDVLAPDLGARGVFLYPRQVLTARRHGKMHRGGMASFDRPRWDIRQWLVQEPGAYVTTMFDLYALPEEFPCWKEAQRLGADPHARAAVLEQALADEIGNRHFIPYIQVHEFEALLFSDVEATDILLSAVDPSRRDELRAVRSGFPSPEHINDGVTTSPSKRLKQLYPSYDKALFGPLIVEQIGLEVLRRECPHFGAWYQRLAALAFG